MDDVGADAQVRLQVGLTRSRSSMQAKSVLLMMAVAVLLLLSSGSVSSSPSVVGSDAAVLTIRAPTATRAATAVHTNSGPAAAQPQGPVDGQVAALTAVPASASGSESGAGAAPEIVLTSPAEVSLAGCSGLLVLLGLLFCGGLVAVLVMNSNKNE